MSSFRTDYQRLNKQQKAAVDQIDGPLLVVAGPGTGKTQLLSVRAAQILKTTDSKAQNILCLTYTEKAAQEMKQRLLKVIGVEARKIVVKTFHGLGVELINLHPEYFWNAAKLQPAPAAVELEIIEQILKQRPHDDSYALKFMGEFTMIDRARNHIAQAKKAGLTPAKLSAVANHNIEYLESILPDWQPLLDKRMSKKLFSDYRELLDSIEVDSLPQLKPLRPISSHLRDSLAGALDEAEAIDKTSPLSQWKQDWTEKVAGERTFKDLKRSVRMVDLAQVYEQFQQQLFGNGYYDFDDMILEVITQLERSSDFRAAVQERFNYIMLDEFQDTNDAQFRLAYLIASHPAQAGRPNVMAVGDDDQAIFRFQGAEINNINSFKQSFTDTAQLVLTDNYRSTQELIDTAEQTASMISHRLIDEDLTLDKQLTQANTEVPDGEIEHISYPTEIEHIAATAELATKQFESGKSVAVLSRSHAPLEQLASVLHSQGTAVRYIKRNDILRHPTVEIYTKLLQLVVAIADSHQELVNELLVDVIGHPMFDLDAGALWQFGVKLRQDRAEDWLNELSIHEQEDFSQIADWLLALAKLSREEPAAVISDYLLGLRELGGFSSPLQDYYLEEDSQLYLESLSAIQKLRSLVVEFRSEAQPTLRDWADFLQLHRQHQVQITDESDFVSSDQAVELLSVHSAKGLEFDHVIIIDAIDKTWSPSGARFRPPANLESMRNPGDDDDDYARLMYVAMTRAQSSLSVISYRSNEHGKEVLPTPLVAHLPLTIEDSSTVDIIETLEQGLRWPQPPLRTQAELLAPLLDGYQLSITHLLNFIDVTDHGPTKFVERNILQLPSVKTAHMAYGTAIHSALEAAQRSINQGKDDSRSIAANEFERELNKQQLPTDEEQQYLGRGQQLLESLFKSDWFELKPGVQPERNIFDVKLKNGAVIRGKLDAVELGAEQIIITDYKTGGSVSRLNTYSKSEGIKALRHKLQLDYYSLLARESGLASDVEVVGRMLYLEADNPKRAQLTNISSEQDLAQLSQLIGAVWQRIHQQRWPDVDNYDDDRAGVEQFIEDLINETD